jgi:hypothetical protein
MDVKDTLIKAEDNRCVQDRPWVSEPAWKPGGGREGTIR